MTARDIRLLWGKLGQGAYPEQSHPAVCHMLDVGHCCQELWRSALGPRCREHWSRVLGLNEDQAGSVIAFWAAVHDIGKISPCFQFQIPAARSRLGSMGFEQVSGASVAHGILSTTSLQEVLSSGEGATWPNLSRRLAAQVARVVGGHHGMIPTSADLPRTRQALGRNQWDVARREVISFLAQHCGISGDVEITEPMGPDRAFWLFLAGLVAVADWVGSNAKFFQADGRWAGPEVELETYAELSRERAASAVRELGFGRWQQRDQQQLAFRDVHAEITRPRPLQLQCENIARQTDDARLVIIEAPMGEGKTEAATYLADHATHALGGRGLYIALPTQATANQMFGRIRRWLEHRYGLESDNERLNLQLLHGRAAFRRDFSEMLELAAINEDAANQDGDGSPDRRTGANVLAETWFAQNRKQQLLAPFGVGTIDQILLAVLRTRHQFVRLFGLASKAVILDEVHAYDAYMSSLLERLLEWLAALRCPVVLLSATLPRERRLRLLQAYSGCVPVGEEVAYPRISVARAESAAVESTYVPADAARRAMIEVGMTDESRLEQELNVALQDGGCVGLICNTVSRAQEFDRRLRAKFADSDIAIELFHARFPLEQRMAIEDRVLTAFGPPSSQRERPQRAIVIATQVIEQSLDLDFDLLISEVAPIDLLLQRAGRLHRHLGRTRPPRLNAPALWLLQPEFNEHGIPEFGRFESGVHANGSYRPGVYDRHILLRTWQTIQQVGDQITLPDDLERLVEAVYSDRTGTADDDAWDSELSRTGAALEEALNQSTGKAQGVRIPAPTDEDLLNPSGIGLEEDSPDIHRDLQAMTRDGGPSITLVLLFEVEGQAYLDSATTNPVDLTSRPSPELTEQLLGRSVSISHATWVNHFQGQPVPTGWQKSSALCHTRPVLLDAAGTYSHGSQTLRLDSRQGLVFETRDLNTTA